MDIQSNNTAIEMLTVKECTQVIKGISESTVRQLVKQGKLPHIKAGVGKNGKNMRNGKPLSRKTAVHHLSFISDVMGYAVKMDIISDNPCRKVTIPKGDMARTPYEQHKKRSEQAILLRLAVLFPIISKMYVFRDFGG